MTLGRDKRPVEVPLGRCFHKKSMVPLDFCSARSLSTVPLDHIEKSSDDDESVDFVSLA